MKICNAMHDLECVNHGQLFIRQSRGDTLKPVGRNEALTNAWSVLPDWLIAYEHVICPFTCMQSCSVSNSWNVRWCQGEINRRDLVREASLSGSRIGASISSFDGMLVSLERERVYGSEEGSFERNFYESHRRLRVQH